MTSATLPMPSTRAFTLTLMVWVALSAPFAAAEEGEEKDLGWGNSTELSLVLTEGNSNTETFGLKDTLTRTWQTARLRFRFEGVRSDTSGERFAVVDSGAPDGFVVEEPDKVPDVEKYLVEARYDREISERLLWHAGAGWDRNLDAGILNRTTAFAGVGNVWWDREDLEFDTSYGLSFTDREEETSDPAKDDQFLGARFSWHYLNGFGASTTYANDWTFNSNLSQLSDFASDMTNSVAVAMNKRVALKISLQWLFNNKPALQSIDLFERDAEGNLIKAGSVDVRKERLDTVFNTSLVINL